MKLADAKAAWESAKAHFIKTGDGYREARAKWKEYRRLRDEHNESQAVQASGPAGSDVERVLPKGSRLR